VATAAEQRADMSDLAGRVAVVTGSARDRSIGGGIARVLARHGADVVVNDLADTDEGRTRVAEIEALGRRSALIPADVTDPEAVAALLAQTVEQMGRLDIVVANAGLCDWQDVSELSAELWERIVGVNLHGAFNTCRAAAAVMRAQGEGGRIIVTSSVHAQMPFAQMGVYGGTKQAIGHLVGVMAREWARDGITVNHIGPGWVASAINDTSPDFATPEAQIGVKRIIPLGHRPGEPEEMGEAVAYLASDGARYTTGAYLRVDGGLIMSPY
jgi:NAD(P)-dependent dehydrogenase (short-subunit alcohol dehydrogenase family)